MPSSKKKFSFERFYNFNVSKKSLSEIITTRKFSNVINILIANFAYLKSLFLQVLFLLHILTFILLVLLQLFYLLIFSHVIIDIANHATNFIVYVGMLNNENNER